jgi:peptidoglycan/LPS O-acetylase OafA/YrhL
MGVISYGMYLYHVWVIDLIEIVRIRFHLGTANRFVMFVTVTVATVIVAEFSFRLLKQPLLPIKERFHFHWRLRGPRRSLTESFDASQSQNRK